MESFKELKNGIEKFLPGIWEIIKGTLLLLLIEAPKELWITFKTSWINSKNSLQKTSTIIAGLIAGSFIIYGIYGLYHDIELWRTEEWREQVISSNYENEINNFFEKYNERFRAHDCNFMREVGSDEAMYDKLNKTEYAKNEYSCEEFVKAERKIMIPLKMEPMQQDDDRFRVKGEAIVIKINQGKPWKIDAIYFNLWKKLDWGLWHFTHTSDGVSKIPVEIEK